MEVACRDQPPRLHRRGDMDGRVTGREFVTQSPSPVGNRLSSRKELAMAIRCKMRLEDVVRNSWGGRKAFFSCAYDDTIPEDQRFQKATPSGSAEFVIDNPKASEQLVIGEYYYLDLHPVPKAEAKAA
jgi:hypothetical protein